MAAVQFTARGDLAANRAALDERLSGLDGVDLVVLPEATMHAFGPAEFPLATIAEPLDGPFVEAVTGHAKRLGATVVAGMFEKTDTLPYNTLVVAGPDGDLVASYRKIHLFDSFGYRESDRLSAGELSPVCVDVGELRLGLLTCYDLRFPELGRALVDDGALALAVPSAWYAGEHKLQQWRTLLAARAIENVAFVIAAGQSAPNYGGHSTIIDPMGTIVAEAGDADETLIGDLEAAAVAAAREVNPSLANRRMRSAP